MNIAMKVTFEEGSLEIKELGKKLEFLRQLPIQAVVNSGTKMLKVNFSGNQRIIISPVGDSVDYWGWQDIKDCVINTNYQFVELSENKSEDHYFFYHKNNEKLD